jgi:hypothetical protein
LQFGILADFKDWTFCAVFISEYVYGCAAWRPVEIAYRQRNNARPERKGSLEMQIGWGKGK